MSKLQTLMLQQIRDSTKNRSYKKCWKRKEEDLLSGLARDLC